MKCIRVYIFIYMIIQYPMMISGSWALGPIFTFSFLGPQKGYGSAINVCDWSSSLHLLRCTAVTPNEFCFSSAVKALGKDRP